MDNFKKIIGLTENEIFKFLEPLYESFDYHEVYSENIQNSLSNKKKSFQLIADEILGFLPNYHSSGRNYKSLIEIAFKTDLKNRSILESINLKNILKKRQFEITEQYNWHEIDAYLSDQNDEIHSTLKLVNVYIKSLPIYEFKKYEFIVDNYHLKDTRNGRRYSEVYIFKLFPVLTNNFFHLIELKQCDLLLKNGINHLQALTFKPAEIPFFTVKDKIRAIFYSDDGFDLFNTYLLEHATAKPDEAFFNRVKIILTNGTINGNIILGKDKKSRMIYKNEILRVFSHLKSYRMRNIANHLLDKNATDFKDINKYYEYHMDKE